jgi:hypothetical protein
MSQTFGSQIFGPWYDAFGWLIPAGILFYLAFTADGMPSAVRQRLPTFLLNKKVCMGMGTFMVMFGVCKAIAILNLQPVSVPADPAVQTGWLEIHSNGKGDAIFIYPSSVSRKADLIEYWNKVTFKEPRTVGSNLRASVLMDKHSANCREQTIAHLRSLGIGDTGQPFNFQFESPEEQAFLPVPSGVGHPDAILFRYVCSH